MSSKHKAGLTDLDVTTSIPALRKLIEEKDEFQKGSYWMKKQPDTTLIRFLKGHHNNPEEAMEAMSAGAKWRWEAGIKELMETYGKDLTAPVVVVKGHWPAGVTGRDHRGKAVVYNHLTAVDFPGLVDAVGIKALVNYMAFQMETLLEEDPLGEAILILDLGLEGLSASFADVRNWIQSLVLWVKKLSQIMDCYPEVYSKIFFIRAPKMFWATWKVTKAFLPERTLQKIKVLSHGVDPLPVLLDIMDSDAIPSEIGGMSRVVLGVGGKVPKGCLSDDDFVNNLRAHVRLMQGDFSNGRRSARYSNLRTKAEENDMQEKLALELLKSQIEEAKLGSSQTSSRGSWRFEPGLDVLNNVDDETLLEELRNENFDPTKALLKLKTNAAKAEGIKLPKDQQAQATGDDNQSNSGDEKDGKKKCVIM